MRWNSWKTLCLLTLLCGGSAEARAKKEPAAKDERPRTAAIEILGNKAISTADLLKRLSLRVGEPFEQNQLTLSKGVIASTYRDQGYYLAEVTGEVIAAKPKQVRVRFTI